MQALHKALVLLVIACPCALVISTPVTVVNGLAAEARRGILIKRGVILEQARGLRAVAMDKSGTLTEGKPRRVAFEPVSTALDGARLALLGKSLGHALRPSGVDGHRARAGRRRSRGAGLRGRGRPRGLGAHRRHRLRARQPPLDRRARPMFAGDRGPPAGARTGGPQRDAAWPLDREDTRQINDREPARFRGASLSPAPANSRRLRTRQVVLAQAGRRGHFGFFRRKWPLRHSHAQVAASAR